MSPCPHCQSPDVDRGATGLDECRACGGLSRDGKPLVRESVPEVARQLVRHVEMVLDQEPDEDGNRTVGPSWAAGASELLAEFLARFPG